jgi:hypothetical protein
MKLIYNTINETVLPWPRIDDEPVIGLESHLLEMTVIEEDEPTYDPATQRLEKTEVIDTDARTVTRGWSVVEAPAPKPAVGAESHIESQGYPAIRLVTLMDLESKLAQAGKTSTKLAAVRSWLDAMLGAFATNPEPHNDWPAAPFGFEETVQDAAMAL